MQVHLHNSTPDPYYSTSCHCQSLDQPIHQGVVITSFLWLGGSWVKLYSWESLSFQPLGWSAQWMPAWRDSPKQLVGAGDLDSQEIPVSWSIFWILRWLVALTMLDMAIGGSTHQDPVRQCHRSVVHKPSGWDQKSGNGRTLCSSLICLLYSRLTSRPLSQ